ncbi:hypothetical protein GCM10023210_09480 [Chryseobacterium ginsengisoli]|uniref:DUF4424 domain-containing protein n=1 Tax=Chryseobacterium ginsengisoli TaxID=363853 RepID=A0ABP9M1I4_9FLAO
MKITNILSFLLILCGIFINCQISLNVKEVDYDKFEFYVPQHRTVADQEIKNKGHILEITLSNNSDKEITLPLDTLSYAIPYTDKIDQYYNKPENIISNPDVFNALGIHPIIYQNNQFKEQELADYPFYEEEQWVEKAKIEEIRLEKINNWKKSRKIENQLFANYNWYILNNMITIQPHQEIKYKIHFNPFSKMLHSLGYQEFYYRLKPKATYEVTFKIILNKNLYQFLTEEDKRKYPNLFTGVISSKTMTFQ